MRVRIYFTQEKANKNEVDIVYEIKGVFFLNTTRSHFEYVERERERERE